jgi:hypothetical protein
MRCSVHRFSHSTRTLKEKCADKDVEKKMKNSRRREIVGGI